MTEQEQGLQDMLNNHPGSALTDEQRKRIEAAAKKESRITGSPLALVEESLRKSDRLEARLKDIEDFDDSELDETEETDIVPHDHKWKRGMLPGSKYIKTCSCGQNQEVDFQTWQTLG